MENFFKNYSLNPDEFIKYNVNYSCYEIIQLILKLIAFKYTFKVI